MTRQTTSLNIFTARFPLPETRAALENAGAVLVDDLAEADAFICHGVAPADFPDLPDRVKWVQLCQAGIEGFFAEGVITAGQEGDRRWSNASGVYGRQVAESAVALLLSVTHMHKKIARAASWSVWRDVDENTRWLHGATVAVVGAGGIGRHLIEMLSPFGADVIAVNRTGHPVEGAARTVSIDNLRDAVAAADHTPPIGVGTSLIVDPMGVELAALGETEDVALAWVSRERIDAVRVVNPALALRRFAVVPR